MNKHPNTFDALDRLTVGDRTYTYYRLDALEKAGLKNVRRLPYSLKILLENLLRFEDGRSVTKDDIEALAQWNPHGKAEREIAYRASSISP
jgi:aconitate hydratase